MASPSARWFYEERARGQVLSGLSPEALQKWEVQRLRNAELFYISEPMAELAKAASRSLPPYALEPEDCPARAGFAFVAPGAYQVVPGVSPVAVICWGDVEGGIFVTLYAATELLIKTLLESGKCTREQAAEHRGIVGDLSPMSFEAVIPYSSDGQVARAAESPFAEEPLLRTLRAAWLLMQQPLAAITEEHADRASRKRLRREGFDPAAVRVISLRRTTRHGESAASDREYHHQWIVRGHWRQQWYPSREVHRPVWIAPHVKGPEGAPLLGGEKVHAWVR